MPSILRRYYSPIELLFRTVDCLWIAFSLWGLTHLLSVGWGEARYDLASLLGILIFTFLAERQELYRSWRGLGVRREVMVLVQVWVGTVFGVLLAAFATKVSVAYSRKVVIAWFLLTPVVLGFWRIMIRQSLQSIRMRGYNTRYIAILGNNRAGLQFADVIRKAPGMGLQLVGVFDHPADGAEDPRTGPQPPVSAAFQMTAERPSRSVDELLLLAQQGKLDTVYVTMTHSDEGELQRIMAALADTPVAVYFLPNLFVSHLLDARWDNIAGVPVISIYETPFDGLNRWIKWLEDYVLATLILVIIALPMLFIAIGVKLSSPGPIIFRQRRYGLAGEVVEIWKFRTMRVTEDHGNLKQAQKNDPRITPFGGFLRRTSLDELPQFINVLQGRMSVIGPRPHALGHNEFYRKLIPGYMLRHRVKPGITGWAQVNGWRGETEVIDKMEKRVDYDLYYIRHWSVWLDIKILTLTIIRGFIGKNAY